MKKIAVGILVVFVLGVASVALLARRVLTGDNVRAAVAAQAAAALGQPVTIGGLGASIYPRVTMDLTDVAIGEPARVQLRSLHVGTSLRALVSRRIENAALRVDGARVLLPLPDLGGTATPGATAAEPGARPPVDIVSIDEIVLRDVEVVRGDRILRGDVELVPQRDGLLLRRVALSADGTAIEMSGRLTSLSPIEGHVDATANDVNFDRMLGFFSDFAAAPAAGGGGTNPSTAPDSMPGLDGRLTIALTVGRATSGSLALSDLRATALVTPAAVTLEPLTFGVFGGRYDGTMHLTAGEAPRFRWRAKVDGIDAAQLMAFAETPNTISGRLSGVLALEGTGLDMETALRTAHGTARVDIVDGAIAGLSLVRTVVLATSGRGGYATSAASALAPGTDRAGAERFSRLGATLSLASGVITTKDFALAATDVDLNAAGTIALEQMTARLEGSVRLSEALSKQGGTDLYRYAQQDGRVTLPATVTGPIGNLAVRLDVGAAATRAIRNRAAEETRKAIERNVPSGLRGLIPKRPPRP